MQSEYSLWTRDLEAVAPVMAELGIGLVAFSPLGRGFLTGTVDRAALSAGDFRARNARFSGEAGDANETIAETVRQVAAEMGATPAQVALAWVYAQSDRLGMPIVAGDRCTGQSSGGIVSWTPPRSVRSVLTSPLHARTESSMTLVDHEVPIGVPPGGESQPHLHEHGRELQRFDQLRELPLGMTSDARARVAQGLNAVLADARVLHDLHTRSSTSRRGPVVAMVRPRP